MTEVDLIRNCKAANANAQRILYDRFASRLYKIALRYVKEKADAEDVIIVTFTKVFRHLKDFTYQGEGSLEAWIKKILINDCLAWLRRRRQLSIMTTLDTIEDEPDLSPLHDLDSAVLYEMISQLPTGYRTVFNLYVVEGYSHQEIASALNVMESTSRTQLFKAKSLLKDMLIKQGYYYGK